MTEDQSKANRPQPPRPTTGFQAWQATIGHISTHISPDAQLRIRAFSREARVIWSADVKWGNKLEEVTDQPSLATALRLLWEQVNRQHRIFDRKEDTVKSPDNFNDAEWLDMATQESLQRVVWVTQTAFPGDWHLVIVYRAVELQSARIRMRLIAKNNTIAVGSGGASLLDTCHRLFQNATPYFAGGK